MRNNSQGYNTFNTQKIYRHTAEPSKKVNQNRDNRENVKRPDDTLSNQSEGINKDGSELQGPNIPTGDVQSIGRQQATYTNYHGSAIDNLHHRQVSTEGNAPTEAGCTTTPGNINSNKGNSNDMHVSSHENIQTQGCGTVKNGNISNDNVLDR